MIERGGEQLASTGQAVEDGVAMRIQRSRRPGGTELLADVYPQRLAQLRIGARELPQGAPDELPGTLLVLCREHHQLHLLVASELEIARHSMHQALRRQGVEMTATKALHPDPARPQRYPYSRGLPQPRTQTLQIQRPRPRPPHPQ